MLEYWKTIWGTAVAAIMALTGTKAIAPSTQPVAPAPTSQYEIASPTLASAPLTLPSSLDATGFWAPIGTAWMFSKPLVVAPQVIVKESESYAANTPTKPRTIVIRGSLKPADMVSAVQAEFDSISGEPFAVDFGVSKSAPEEEKPKAKHVASLGESLWAAVMSAFDDTTKDH